MEELSRIGFGGGCHWCTEAVFQSLIGVEKVEQGWIASLDSNSEFSEAVIVHYRSEIISLKILTQIHLHTHSSTVNHSFRRKYRSAIYTFDEKQALAAELILENLQVGFMDNIITEVLSFVSFKSNKESFLDYYYSDRDKPFCKSIIDPKIKKLISNFSGYVKKETAQSII